MDKTTLWYIKLHFGDKITKRKMQESDFYKRTVVIN